MYKRQQQLPSLRKAADFCTDHDFTVEDGVLVKYTGTEAHVVIPENVTAVSYTHLDVYKRQSLHSYSTVEECALHAAAAGLRGFVVTDHCSLSMAQRRCV